jgi:predicted secreted protein
MRRLFTVTLVVALMGSPLMACSNDSTSDGEGGASISDGNGADMLVFTDPTTPIAVVPGQQFAVRLESNPATGYAWSATEGPSAEQVAVVEGEAMTEATDEANGLVGVPGTSTFVFQAINSGSTQVTFTYARPADPTDNPSVTTFTINVS